MGIEHWGHEWGRAPHNEWEHIYPSHWVWPRGGTSTDYDSGSGFFRVHWEMVLPDRPNQVALHVEAPVAEVDATLNELKIDIIEALAECNIEAVATELGLGYKRLNRKESTLANQKLSAAFSVTLPTGWATESAFADMVRVHAMLGEIVDAAILAVTPRIDSHFLTLPGPGA